MFWFALSAFCVSTGLLVYTHLGYPMLVIFLAKWFGRKHRAIALASDEELPRISVLIAAYNAEDHIEQRLANLFDTDFPIDRMEVVVATDGSTDQTARLARMAGWQRVRVIEFSQRRGKTATLVSSMPALNHEVVVFTDATTTFDRRTLRLLTQQFVDPAVGIVTGRVEMHDPAGKSSEGLYWKLESRLREAEASLDALVGASGAVYAIRRQCFVPPTSVQLNDDLVLPMLARLRTNTKFVFEPKAIARVVSPSDLASDFRRRVRVGTGAFQSFRELGGLLLPSQGRVAVSFWSHKVFRWLSPLMMLAAFVSNLMLVSVNLFQFLLVGQLVFYAAACAGIMNLGGARHVSIVRVIAAFVVVNGAFAVGFWGWLLRRNQAVWEPTVRPIEAPQPHTITGRGATSRVRTSRRASRRIG